MIAALCCVCRLAGLVVLMAAAGCATGVAPQDHHAYAEAQARECADWYDTLDAAVEAAGMRGAAMANDQALDALIDRLVGLDLATRGHEISNLPTERLNDRLKDVPAGSGESQLAAVMRRTRDCGSLLRRIDMANPELRKALLERLRVPDDYVTGYRIAGLYARARIAFLAGVRRLEADAQAAFGRDLGATGQGTVVRYSPLNRPRLKPAQVREILARSAVNPLRVPEPAQDDLEALFANYAPSFEVDTTGDYDRPGALRWRWGPLPEVDAADPVLYRQVAHTRYGGVNPLQLVYTVWFSERPAQAGIDLLSGALDGVVFRVTLAPDGTPLAYDSMHSCGCYHMFFPTPRAVLLPPPSGEFEWVFAPQTLAQLGPEDRLVVRLAPRTHYVERVYHDQTDSLATYELRPYDALRSLPRMHGGARSVFGPDGIIAGTDRREQWLVWPMGIASAGAMRQWGRHATAFVGRRHFDDADLMERRFVLELK